MSSNNILTLHPKQASEILAHTLKLGENTLLVGPPGIGKTDITTAAAKQSGHEVILSHPVVWDVVDVKGLPWPAASTTEATFLPFGDLAKALRATAPTVWVFDDLGQAPVSVQAGLMQILHAREVNGHKIPDCVKFIACTNRKSDRAGVTGFIEPLKTRFATILHVTPSLEDWVEWALSHGVPAELVAFIRFRSELLFQFTPSAEIVNSPCPRTWEAVGHLISGGIPQHLELLTFAGAVGKGPATELVAFLRTYRNINVDEIFANPQGARIPSEVSVVWATAVALARNVNAARFDAMVQYLIRLYEHGRCEHAALCFQEVQRSNIVATLGGSPGWKRLLQSPLNDMLTGGFAHV